jgi:alpha-methylacyl-CoA racemase
MRVCAANVSLRNIPRIRATLSKGKFTKMGPLKGITVIELAGIGPAPFAGMLLADMGATVVRVDRREDSDLGIPGREPKFDVLGRGRQSIAVDMKSAVGREVVVKLCAKADVLIEGFRPGVIERLGIGPDVLHQANPRLVIGRMTGFGQHGPWADRAGHDIDYIALAGALHAFGRKGQAPTPPLNMVGDFGGGGMFLAFGVVAALLEAKMSGKGQVVDAAMVDGTAYLMGMIFGMRSAGRWQDDRGINILDTGAPWYDVYETSDGKWLAVGAIETKFYAELIEKLDLAGRAGLPKQFDMKRWPELRAAIAEAIKGRSRDEWERVFDGSDACVAPVLSLDEAPKHPHMAARQSFVTRNGVTQPAPAPRFSRSTPEMGREASAPGVDTDQVLADFGFSAADIAALKAAGVVGRNA